MLRPRALAHRSCRFWLGASVLSALGSLAAAADLDLCATTQSQYSSYGMQQGICWILDVQRDSMLVDGRHTSALPCIQVLGTCAAEMY